MKHIIIGTAGHIDHGKTTLIRALTGRNTDRLIEEQKRGITIDLGFTYFDLRNGDVAGIIDVPGHEKFVNNMVAGVVGMDLVLLVVAADEGIMPQTREHMDILELLGVKKCIIVLNKCDIVDGEWLELMEEEIKENLKGTFLENSPMARVSAVTGEGIPELAEMIRKVADEVGGKDINTIPRLPVDRVFSIAGFGTVVTGTLISGSVSKDDRLEMFPQGAECKIRSIQVHGKDVEKCRAGQRVAINIPNLKKNEIKRGCVLAPPKSMKPSRLLDVKLKMISGTERALKNNTRLHFFCGTTQALCRAVLLGDENLRPGESGYVQLKMEEAVAFRRDDRFVVRFYSPEETIGGGVILEPNAVKKKRFSEKALHSLRQKESGAVEDVIELHVREYAGAMISLSELAKLTALSENEVRAAVENLRISGAVIVFPMKKDIYVWHMADEKAARQKITSALSDYVKKYPYRLGMPKAEVYSAFLKNVKPAVFAQYIERLISDGLISGRGEFLSPAGFSPPKDATFEKARRILLGAVKPAGFEFVRLSEINFKDIPKETIDDIVAFMSESGELVKVAESMYTMPEFMDQARAQIEKVLKAEGKITIAQVRDMFSTTRKSAKPILEYMDRIKVTKKTGAQSERLSNL